MKKLFLVYSYFKYRLKSVNAHGVHSPFVFSLLNDVIYNTRKYYIYEEIELLRKTLVYDDTLVICTDLGAGSLNTKKQERTIRHHALHSAKSPKYAQLIFRLVNYFQPSHILELGTSLGITTCYMAKANSKSQITTIEGCGEIAAIATHNFELMEINNIKQLTGNFDTVLPLVITETERLDFVFFDGNHRKEATLNYFNQCLKIADANSIFVFDDVYWSAEMKEAWDEIKNNKQVTVTIDLFYLGIVFFRKEQVKQNFVIRF